MPTHISSLYINQKATIRDAITCIDNSRKLSIALLVDEQDRLVATITDGDIRRAILAGYKIDSPIDGLLRIKQQTEHPAAVTAPVGTSRDRMIQIMQDQSVRQLPLVDPHNRPVDIVTLSDFLPQGHPNLCAVIMAGGLGTRLRPLTDHTPKPMLPVGDKPIMHLIVDQLTHAGIQQAFVTTHYLGDKIKNYFGDGKKFGISLHYIEESEPLGTAGALSQLENIDVPVLVINGDVLTNLDFRIFLQYHEKYQAELTVGVRQYQMQVPYGVIDCYGNRVTSVSEKPICNYLVNTGIYLLQPHVLRYVPKGKRFDMTELIENLICMNMKVVSFPIMEYWLDVGQSRDYMLAQEEIKNRNGVFKFYGNVSKTD